MVADAGAHRHQCCSLATARDPEALRTLVEPHAQQAFALQLDVVFNNAGYGHAGAIEELSEVHVFTFAGGRIKRLEVRASRV